MPAQRVGTFERGFPERETGATKKGGDSPSAPNAEANSSNRAKERGNDGNRRILARFERTAGKRPCRRAKLRTRRGGQPRLPPVRPCMCVCACARAYTHTHDTRADELTNDSAEIAGSGLAAFSSLLVGRCARTSSFYAEKPLRATRAHRHKGTERLSVRFLCIYLRRPIQTSSFHACECTHDSVRGSLARAALSLSLTPSLSPIGPVHLCVSEPEDSGVATRLRTDAPGRFLHLETNLYDSTERAARTVTQQCRK